MKTTTTMQQEEGASFLRLLKEAMENCKTYTYTRADITANHAHKTCDDHTWVFCTNLFRSTLELKITKYVDGAEITRRCTIQMDKMTETERLHIRTIFDLRKSCKEPTTPVEKAGSLWAKLKSWINNTNN